MKRFLLKSAAFLALYVLAVCAAYGLRAVSPFAFSADRLSGVWIGGAAVCLWPAMFGLTRVKP